LAVTRTNYLVLTAILFLLGVLGMLAYRTNSAVGQIEAIPDRQAQLVAVVQELEDDNLRLQQRLGEVRKQAAELEKQVAARQGLYRTFNEELERLRMQAGLVPVVGDGLQVSLRDNPQPPDGVLDPNDFIVHDYDVRILVNALWAGGAEAVAVNDQRVVGTSAIRCVGTTILVNSTRIGSPFSIEAVGDAARLRKSLDEDDDARHLIQEQSKTFGLGVEVKEQQDLELPAYVGSMAPRHLRTDGDQEPEAMEVSIP
jgi:uncharacterized protein YlxW (UPF0749 family)